MKRNSIPNIPKLREITQEKSYPDFHQRIIRKLSIYLTRILLIFGLSANQVSFLNIILGISGNLILLTNYKIYWFAIPIIIFLCTILDHTDGEIARFRKKSCLTGLFIDRAFPIIVFPLLYICISINIYFNHPSVLLFVIGFLTLWNFLLSRLLISYTPYSVIDGILNPKKAGHSYNHKKAAESNYIANLNKENKVNFGLEKINNKIINIIMNSVIFVFNKGVGISLTLFFFILLEVKNIKIIGSRPLFIFLILNLLFFSLSNLWIIIKTIKNQLPDKILKSIYNAGKVKYK